MRGYIDPSPYISRSVASGLPRGRGNFNRPWAAERVELALRHPDMTEQIAESVLAQAREIGGEPEYQRQRREQEEVLARSERMAAEREAAERMAEALQIAQKDAQAAQEPPEVRPERRLDPILPVVTVREPPAREAGRLAFGGVIEERKSLPAQIPLLPRKAKR